jgi:hypothetical protein
LSDQQIEDLIFGRLDSLQRDDVESHLLLCQECLSRVEAEEDFVGTIKAAADLAQRPEHPAASSAPALKRLIRDWRAWLGAAAAALALFVLVQDAARRPAVEIQLLAMRSSQSGAPEYPSGHPLHLRASVSNLETGDECLMEVVDLSGAVRASDVVSVRNETASWKLKDGLPPGSYWVRVLRKQDHDFLREFALVIR